MKIQYKQFIIEEDTYSYILSETGIKEKGANIGEEYIMNQTYPATFERAIESMIKRLRARKTEAVQLREYITEFKKLMMSF